MWQEDRELVPAEPGDRVSGTDARRSRWAACRRSSSPVRWPSVSLISLKRSRSNQEHPDASVRLLAEVSAGSSRSSSWARFGRLVSWSW